MTKILLEKLDWDSLFFEVPVFSVKSIYNTKNSEEIELDFGVEPISSTYLIQALVENNAKKDIITLTNKGFIYTESKITFFKNLNAAKLDTTPLDIRELTESDIEPVKKRFYDLYGNTTRYSIFDRNKINLFYFEWLKKSIYSEFDDSALGIFVDDVLAGFITFRIRKHNITIGLIGIFPEFQGKSLASTLIKYVERIGVDNECRTIEVSTQEKNLRAINTYIKAGFFVREIKHWFYKHQVKT